MFVCDCIWYVGHRYRQRGVWQCCYCQTDIGREIGWVNPKTVCLIYMYSGINECRLINELVFIWDENDINDTEQSDETQNKY